AGTCGIPRAAALTRFSTSREARCPSHVPAPSERRRAIRARPSPSATLRARTIWRAFGGLRRSWSTPGISSKRTSRRRWPTASATGTPGRERTETDMGLLDGKVAIITGASKGIGRALSLRFGREGAAVVCAARSADLVKETAAKLTGAGGGALGVVCDAAQEDEVRRLVATGVKEFGKVDTLVNNAGDGGPTKPVQDYLMEDWRYTIDSCLTSSYLCTRFVVPEMIKAGGGGHVNNSAGAGRPRS